MMDYRLDILLITLQVLLTPISNSDYYSFAIDDGASPDLVGQAYDSADVVMKVYF